MLYGRVSNLWIPAHQKLMGFEEPHKSKRWLKELIRKLIEVAWDFWSHRNGIKFADTHPWKMEERNRLKRLVLEHFQKGRSTLLSEDRPRLHSLEQVLGLSPDQQQQWIQSMDAARHRWDQRNTKRRKETGLDGMRANFKAWLSREPASDGEDL